MKRKRTLLGWALVTATCVVTACLSASPPLAAVTLAGAAGQVEVGITDPTAVAFCNAKVRRLADLYSQLYYASQPVIDEWNARGGTAFIPARSDVVADGADQDGRPQITGAQVVNLIVRLQELATDLEAADKAKLNTLLAVAVNPTER